VDSRSPAFAEDKLRGNDAAGSVESRRLGGVTQAWWNDAGLERAYVEEGIIPDSGSTFAVSSRISIFEFRLSAVHLP